MTCTSAMQVQAILKTGPRTRIETAPSVPSIGHIHVLELFEGVF